MNALTKMTILFQQNQNKGAKVGQRWHCMFTPNVCSLSWGYAALRWPHRRVKSLDQIERAKKCHFKLGHHSPYTQDVTHRDTIWSLRSASSVNQLIHGWRSRAHGHQCIRTEKISRPTCRERRRRKNAKCIALKTRESKKRMSHFTLRVHRALKASSAY